MLGLFYVHFPSFVCLLCSGFVFSTDLFVNTTISLKKIHMFTGSLSSLYLLVFQGAGSKVDAYGGASSSQSVWEQSQPSGSKQGVWYLMII